MLLGVNIDHVATLRNARLGEEPSVIEAANTCINAGANGITAHLREDRRHILDKDIYMLKDLGFKLNMEMAATEDMQRIALKVKPNSCCIVPEKRKELTTEGGLNVLGNKQALEEFIAPLIDKGIIVSLFIDPSEQQVSAASDIGAQFIELHTGAYSRAFGTDKEKEEFIKLKRASALAHIMGLGVNAGHGLDYNNVQKICDIEALHELNIGYSIISRAIFTGLDKAVKDMLKLINKS